MTGIFALLKHSTIKDTSSVFLSQPDGASKAREILCKSVKCENKQSAFLQEYAM